MGEPPYEGQGLPLDESAGVDGEWVIKDHVFLFAGPAAQLTTSVRIGKDVNCPGFNVGPMAPALKCAPDDIFFANRARVLKVEWQEHAPTSRGAERTVTYIFTMPSGERAAAPLHIATIQGRA